MMHVKGARDNNMKCYKPLIVVEHEVQGLYWAMRAMRLPKGSTGDTTRTKIGVKDLCLASNLIKSGDDHSKVMRGVVVWVRIQCQVGWLIDFETYRHGVECMSTSSTMHTELQHITGVDLAEKKQSLLSKKVYTRDLTISYQTLRRIYFARKGHRHPDFKTWRTWTESLPYAKELITIKR